MLKMNQALRLIIRILKNGKLRHSGSDFQVKRSLNLAFLMEHLSAVSMSDRPRGWFMRNMYLRTLVGEAAYLRRGLRSAGGHLSLSDPGICYIRIPRVASTSLSRSLLLKKIPALQNFALTPEEINSLTD